MLSPSTPEFHRNRHHEHTARLRTSMHRAPRYATRYAIGSWLVSAGLRLAPDRLEHDRSPVVDQHPEASRASGCVPA